MNSWTADFSGRTVIVTGAGWGIGRATLARIVADDGAIVVVDLSRERLNAVSAAFGHRVRGVTGDPGPVAPTIEAPFLSEWAHQRLGPIIQTTAPAVAQPAQLAAASAWLLNDEAPDVSGALLPVDGGGDAV